VQRTDAGRCRILLGFCDPQATALALRAGLEISGAIFARAGGGLDTKRALAALIQNVGVVMQNRQPDFIARALMRAARTRNMPFYAVSPGSRTWLYGQGKSGLYFFEAASQRDSLTGSRIVRDKFLSNQLVTQLGLPGVKHGIAHDVKAAAQIAAQLGFPVVVKPTDKAKGTGVSTNVTTLDELAKAFARASKLTARNVIVERQVPGDDHRIAVFGGRFAWAVRRSPPRLVGDGQHTVTELLERENDSRSDAEVAAGFVKRLTIDADMLAVLAKQQMRPEDRPEAGRVVRLRDIANTATGGTIADCSAGIHPDNRQLAETIARSFRMDALGIDFMTPDITKSWREVDCAVLEINQTPGFSSDGRAEIILREAFPLGTDGRIPSVVLIGAAWPIVERVAKVFQAAGACVGRTDATMTILGEHPRCKDARSLHDRVLSLLLDGGCEALVIGASPGDIERHGFPLDRCDLALIAEETPVADPLRTLIGDCAASTIDGVTESNIDAKVSSAVTAILVGAHAGRT
jgi:cyanophycin synthetase